MATITQLDPPIPLETPKGSGLAHLVIDYGPEFNLLWTVFLNDSGECWSFSNTDVRAQKNASFGMRRSKPLPLPLPQPHGKS